MEYEDLKKIKKNNKKKNIFLILTIILSLGISLAAIYYIYAYRDSRENTLATGLISIDFSESGNVINLNNTVPVLDEVGLSNTPYIFTVTNTSRVPINAKIMLDIDSSTTIDLGAVRYAFYINDELIKKDYIHEDDLTLYTYNNMSAGKTLNCKLVFWIDYYYETSGETFKAKVKAEGESFDIIVGKPGNEMVLKAATDRANDGSSCLTTVEEDGITYISGTKDCINFNYVWWSGKMWRITAIYPDGAMKMVTDNNITSIAFNESNNVTYYNKTNGSKSYMFQWLNEDFLDTLYNNGSDVIDTTKYWNATMPANTTISTKPAETDATMIPITTSPVGLLNSYEYYKSYQNTSYENGYLNIGYYWWLLNPYNASRVWYVNDYGLGYNASPTNACGARPSVYLKSGISLSGSGTKENPYRLSYDYDSANTNDLVNTRHSGEYVKLSNNGTEQIFRIVGVEDNKTKIVAMDYADNKATRKFATSTESANTLWGSGTTTDADTWYTYLNSTYYPNLITTYGELFDSNLYYLGTSGYNYKLSVCANTTSGNTKVCDKTSQTGTFNIGLLRYGEMYATQQGSGSSSSIVMWLINRYSASRVWNVDYYGNGFNYSPTDAYGARPSIHLKSTVKILSGTGTELDPYVVGL